LDRCDLLLWIHCVVLPNGIPRCPVPDWQILVIHRVSYRPPPTTRCFPLLSSVLLLMSFHRLAWAIVLMCHAACENFAGLMVARFFLGVTEAAVAPGFSLMTGMFYTRLEQPFRHGVWFLGNSLASIVGGVIAYGIGNTHTSLAPWRVLFLIFGAITAFWSVVMFVLLPDSPDSARYMTEKEKMIAVARVSENKTGSVKSGAFRKHQMLEALKDPQAWLLALYVFCVNLPNGGLTAVRSSNFPYLTQT